MKSSEEIHDVVRERYARAATANTGCCGSGASTSQLSSLGYDAEATEVSPGAASGSLGCGNPHVFTELRAGDVVLDIGSGAGLDSLLASQRVGEDGRVIGVDLTPEMIDRATGHAKEAGVTNVDYRLGEAEKLPVESDSIDWVMSNCVINLTADKVQAFREIHRVLKPGGKLSVSDIVLGGPIPDSLRDDPDAYAACVSGALPEAEYLGAIREAGFDAIDVQNRSESASCGDKWEASVVSLHVVATKQS